MNDIELAEEIARHPVTLKLPHTCKPDSLEVDIDGRALTYEENQQIIAALRRWHERPPSGEMVMVPREPTKEMIEAGKDERMECFKTEGRETNPISVGEALTRIYRAMLSATEAEGRKG